MDETQSTTRGPAAAACIGTRRSRRRWAARESRYRNARKGRRPGRASRDARNGRTAGIRAGATLAPAFGRSERVLPSTALTSEPDHSASRRRGRPARLVARIEKSPASDGGPSWVVLSRWSSHGGPLWRRPRRRPASGPDLALRLGFRGRAVHRFALDGPSSTCQRNSVKGGSPGVIGWGRRRGGG
jgi:hypothetical protein